MGATIRYGEMAGRNVAFSAVRDGVLIGRRHD